MKKAVLSLVAFILALVAYGASARHFEVSVFESAPMDLSAGRLQRVDSKGRLCALIKIACGVDDVKFSGNFVGDIEKKGGEYYVFAPAGSGKITISHPQLETTTYKYPAPLMGGVTYHATLSLPEEVFMQILASRAIIKAANKYRDMPFAEKMRLADKGDSEAVYSVGLSYQFGEGVAEDLHQAVEWYRRSAYMGNPKGQLTLGYLIQNGIGMEQNDAFAFELCSAVVERGDDAVRRRDAGKPSPETADEEFVRWHSMAQYNVANAYEFGKGVEPDYYKAAAMFAKSAEQGFAQATNMLGYCYENGLGVEPDYDRAWKLYNAAVEQGCVGAKVNVGGCYYKGIGVNRDFAEALKWLKDAAQHGLVQAQFNVGLCYANGEGTAQDFTEALKWFQKAAEQGLAQAQYDVGLIYERGLGVEVDIPEAIRWYRMAAEQKHVEAMTALLLLGAFGDDD
ncbi:MAG: hypothetical protein ACI30D_04640 [Muribaculaceae bacterium]|nr:tetratricopeptide repeat protein [Muribaculaceae bacterium]